MTKRSELYIFLILILVLIVGGFVVKGLDTGTTAIVDDFLSCEEAGNPVMESYPRQCRHNDITYTEDLRISCTPEQRDVFCTQQYEPVCGLVNIQCITTPCDPVEEVFGNACTACSNSLVGSYVPGECTLGR